MDGWTAREGRERRMYRSSKIVGDATNWIGASVGYKNMSKICHMLFI